MERTEQYLCNSDFLLREIAGEYLLVPTGQSALTFNGMASLNETAAFLWKLLEQPHTAQELAQALAVEYELTAEQSQSDVDELLAVILERGLVRKL